MDNYELHSPPESLMSDYFTNLLNKLSIYNPLPKPVIVPVVEPNNTINGTSGNVTIEISNNTSNATNLTNSTNSTNSTSETISTVKVPDQPPALRQLYNPAPVKSFGDAVIRDINVLLSFIPGFSIIFRDIPFWFLVVSSLL